MIKHRMAVTVTRRILRPCADIKGGNILVTKDGVVKLTDFGTAVHETGDSSALESMVGSPFWMSPEAVEMAGATSASDIWCVRSLRCTMRQLYACSANSTLRGGVASPSPLL
jgi:serine/threonine protein kinase